MLKVFRGTYLRLEMRLKDCSTLQSIPSRRQREHASAGVWTISHLSCAARPSYQHAGGRGCDWGGLFGRIESRSGICMWLTFCCLHSLQAFRLPPRRLPVTGGTFSISPDSGLLFMDSTPDGGRGSLGDRKSLRGIRGGPFGANRCRYSKSIEIGLRSPDIKPHGT